MLSQPPQNRWAMPSWRFAQLSASIGMMFSVSACQPTVDLSGTYVPIDYPWSGWPKIEIATSFPSILFTGTFTVYPFFEYIEIPIIGTVTARTRSPSHRTMTTRRSSDSVCAKGSTMAPRSLSAPGKQPTTVSATDSPAAHTWGNLSILPGRFSG